MKKIVALGIAAALSMGVFAVPNAATAAEASGCTAVGVQVVDRC